MKECRMLSFQMKGDERGALTILEENKEVPFQMKRIFYIYDSDATVVRGCHANRKSEFILIAVTGSLKVKVTNGKEEEIYQLDSPNKGLYLDKMAWKEMYDFSSGAVLLCLASEPYDPHEYIRDYDEFLKEVNAHE